MKQFHIKVVFEGGHSYEWDMTSDTPPNLGQGTNTQWINFGSPLSANTITVNNFKVLYWIVTEGKQ